MENTVYLERCSSYDEEEVKVALNNLLTLNHLLDFVQKGMRIGLKVNLVSPMKPEKCATTNPVLVKVLSKMLVEKGAIVTIGDSPGGLFTESALNSSYKITHMSDAEEAGAHLNHNFATTIIDIDGKIVKKLDITSWILEQDAVINVCKLKSHGMMGLSASVKNLFGTVPGLSKPEYHYRYQSHSDFANMIIDINETVKCRLNIMDAVMAMEGNGPTQGVPKYLGLLTASTNPYAEDLVACKLIDLDYQTVPTVVESIKRGLTKENINELILSRPLDEFLCPDFKKIKHTKDMSFNLTGGPIGKFVSNTIKKILLVRPKVTKKECIGCKKCFNICPAKAITMKKDKPVIDQNKCIRCFCCQEFCPTGAMKAYQNKIVKALKGKKK